MDSNHILQFLKSSLKYILVTIFLVAVLSVGFFVAIGFIVVIAIAVPIVRFIEKKRTRSRTKESNSKNKYDDAIDAEFVIIEEKDDNKK